MVNEIIKMVDNESQTNKIIKLVSEPSWNMETFIVIIKHAAQRKKALVFWKNYANKLSESLSLKAVTRLKDPRPEILNFIREYKNLSKIEASYYQQIVKPALEHMISSQPNCIHRVSSSNIFKRALLKVLQHQFNLEPHFISFISQMKNEIEKKIIP